MAPERMYCLFRSFVDRCGALHGFRLWDDQQVSDRMCSPWVDLAEMFYETGNAICRLGFFKRAHNHLED
jgi:hypothetical protein